MKKLISYVPSLILSSFILSPTFAYAQNTIDSLSADDDKSTITFQMKGSFSDGAQSHVRFFIDTDNNSATGSTKRHSKGAEYQIKDKRFYKWERGKWQRQGATIKTEKNRRTISAEVQLSELNPENTIQFTGIVADSKWGDWQKFGRMVEYQVSSKPPASRAPYSQVKFQPVLQQSKLQWPFSGTDVAFNAFAGVNSDHFYLSPERYMTFATGARNVKRSELRQGPEVHEWSTASTIEQKMVGEVKLFHPKDVTEYTWMQIHDLTCNENDSRFECRDGDLKTCKIDAGQPCINKPLIRLAWRADKDGYEDYLWIVTRDNNIAHTEDGALSSWHPLMKRPDSFFEAKITVKDSWLSVYIDGNLRHEQSVAYWDDFQNYFKAGVYLSGPKARQAKEGKRAAKVQFKTLSY